MKVRDKLIADFIESLDNNQLVIAKEVDPEKESFHTVLKSEPKPMFLKKVELDDEVEENTILSIIRSDRWKVFCKDNVLLGNIKNLPNVTFKPKK
jgi:hypothetical protein